MMWMPMFEESVRHHEARAAWHVEQRHPEEWAQGSLRKAEKWRRKQRDLRALLHPDPPDDPLGRLVHGHIERIMDEMVASMTRSVLR